MPDKFANFLIKEFDGYGSDKKFKKNKQYRDEQETKLNGIITWSNDGKNVRKVKQAFNDKINEVLCTDDDFKLFKNQVMQILNKVFEK